MFKNSTIRSVLAFAMLLVFTFSITPKRYLHDLFAGHQDTTSKVANDGKVHVTQSGFNCDCNTLVATSPFTAHADVIAVTCPPEYPVVFIARTIAFYSSSHSFAELRGPPSQG